MRTSRPNQSIDSEYMKTLNSTVEKDATDQKEAALALSKSVSSGDQNTLMESPYYRQWLEVVQSKNPLIKRHVQAAPEYNTPTKTFGEVELDINSEEAQKFMSILDQEHQQVDIGGDDVFDVNLPQNEGPALKMTSEKKFLDVVIAENITRSLPAETSVDEVKEKVIESMREFHEDDGYIPEIEIEPIVESTRVLMIANQQEASTKKRFLGKYTEK